MKENNSITAEQYPRLFGWELKENENGIEMAILPAEKVRKVVEWCEYAQAKLNEYKSNTVTLEQLEEEVVKVAADMFIGLGYGSNTSKSMADDYYENKVLPKYKKK